jgi:hypothetical protein
VEMNLNDFKIRIKDRLWNCAKDSFYPHRVKDAPLVKNINCDGSNNQRRALVCYSPQIYFQNIDIRTLARTIPIEMFKLVKILSEYRYCIDIISVNDIRALDFIKSASYHLIFGFGETFCQITQLKPDALSVFYVTENHPDVSYREEKKRIDYFYERHKRKASMQRSGRYYKPEHTAVKYDHIIALGEIEHYTKQYEKPYSLFPTGFLNSNFVFKQKDHVNARKHFLWLGSSAVIHKGLDLLIDVIRERDDITLHICGLDQLSRELLDIPNRSNIIDYGFISINSDTFLNIAETCSFSILPSCSEGMATSITTSMLHGLVPVVIKDTGFNRLGEYAIFLDDYKVDYLDDMLSRLAKIDPLELEVLSQKVRAFASRNFSPEAYENQLRSILAEIIQ